MATFQIGERVETKDGGVYVVVSRSGAKYGVKAGNMAYPVYYHASQLARPKKALRRP